MSFPRSRWNGFCAFSENRGCFLPQYNPPLYLKCVHSLDKTNNNYNKTKSSDKMKSDSSFFDYWTVVLSHNEHPDSGSNRRACQKSVDESEWRCWNLEECRWIGLWHLIPEIPLKPFERLRESYYILLVSKARAVQESSALCRGESECRKPV